jgi:MSHA biogenesis protein MshN
MSVLNKMLRDLEQRQSHTAAIAEPSIAPVSTARWPFVLLALCVVLLCMLWYVNSAPTETTIAAPDAGSAMAAQRIDTAAGAVLPSGQHATETGTVAAVITAMNLPATPELTASSAQQIGAVLSLAAVEAEPEAQADTAISLTEPESYAATAAEVAGPAAQAATAAASSKVVVSTLQIERSEQTVAQRNAALRQQAMAAEQAGQLQQALQLWQQLQQGAPQQAEAYLAQARLWAQLGQPAQAEQLLQLGVRQGIASAELQLLLAQQFAARSQWQQVEALLAPHFELTKYPEYYALKATALQQLGQSSAALHWFSQLIVQQPQQARWWLGAAIALDAQAQHQQAQLHFRQALQWGSTLSEASRNYIQQRLGATE